MNQALDDFSDIIDNNLKIEREIPKFHLTQLEVKHYYWNYDVIDGGTPISTSIELNCNYNLEIDKLIWIKKVKHTYLSFEDSSTQLTDTYTEEIDNGTSLVNNLEKYDLRNLKNNYFTDTEPNNYSHWELTYNYYFKISGTYDQKIEEFKHISEILQLKKTMEKEIEKVQNKIKV